MENKKIDFKEKVIDYFSTRVTNAVSPKNKIYEAIHNLLPFADVDVKTVSDEVDEVKINFGDYSVTFMFNWENRTDESDPDFKKYKLTKLV
jgi:hypothetical protein